MQKARYGHFLIDAGRRSAYNIEYKQRTRSGGRRGRREGWFRMNLRERLRHNPMNQLYDEARLPQAIRRSLNCILLGHIFGSVCGPKYQPSPTYIPSTLSPRFSSPVTSYV